MSLTDLAPAAIAFVFIAVVISIGAEVLGGVQEDQAADTYAYNATAKGLESMSELSTWLPTIALVVAAAAVIGVLAFFGANR
jgi:hypothetical protein